MVVVEPSALVSVTVLVIRVDDAELLPEDEALLLLAAVAWVGTAVVPPVALIDMVLAPEQ
jgi:hypothetical protein